MRFWSRVVTGAFAACVVLVTPNAGAVERKGFVIGFGAGPGHSRVEGEGNTAVGSSFHIGGMLGSKTALLLDGAAVSDSEEGFTAGFGVSGVAVQRWVHERAWVKAGIGSGFAFVSGKGESDTEDAGFGIQAGAGYELVQKTKFTLDLQARFTTSSKNDVRINNYMMLLGVNWW
jgi:hypothetical protein